MASSAGCEHYVRSCLLKAPCCGKLYVCRLCHDAEENHQMDRFKVKEVQCSDCLTLQKAQQTCEKCSVQFGEYYCAICHLFDKDKKQYHCQPCGICRIGPREEYFHCNKCNLCLAQVLEGKHKCVENVSRQDCPVCMEDIHTSRIGAHVLPCGHLLHKTCFNDMLKNCTYRCPLCMHSALEMQNHWEEMDQEIAQSPMPTEYRNTTVRIICNDCQAHSTASFHVLGMKCGNCGSYNTAQDGGLIQNENVEQPEERHENSDTEPETDTEEEARRAHEDAARAHEGAARVHEDAARAHEDVARVHEDALQVHEAAARAHEDAWRAHEDAARAHEEQQEPTVQ